MAGAFLCADRVAAWRDRVIALIARSRDRVIALNVPRLILDIAALLCDNTVSMGEGLPCIQ